MALSRPDTGQAILQCNVAGLAHHDYCQVADYLRPGDALSLQAKPENPHDKSAVAVCANGWQIGWVPKYYNLGVSSRLLAGEKLTAKVLGLDADQLVMAICGQPAAAPSVPEPLAVIDEFGKPSDYPERIQLLRDLPVGTKLFCRSTAARSSIDLRREPGDWCCAWFRKDGLPLSVSLFANTGRLVAIIQNSHPLKVALYEAGKEPLKISANEIIGGLTATIVSAGTITADPGQSFLIEGLMAGSTTTTTNSTTKETTMNFSNATTKFITNNQSAASQAGFLEAGRIANNQFAKVAGKAMPMMVRGYVDTPVGKLLIANVAQMAAAQLRPNDSTLAKLTNAMSVAAYQAVIQTVDIEGWLNDLLASPEIARALSKLPQEDAPAAAKPVINNI